MRASTTTALLATALLARGEAAQQVRVTLRVIEVPHAQVVKWTGGAPMKGWQLHDEAVKLALAGGAEIVETSMLTVQNANKAVVESVAEIVYPTELWVSNLSGPPMLTTAPEPLTVQDARRVSFASFDTRNTGNTLEIEPTVAAGGNMVDLGLSLEMVDRASSTIWSEFRDEWGDASVRMPVFDTKRFSNSIVLANGVFELWHVFNPRPAAVPAVTTRMMVFVCADILLTDEKQ